MTDRPVELTPHRADRLVTDFRHTAAFRGWTLLACAVMWNHVHLVVALPDETARADILRDFKRRASRALNADAGGPRRWWTRSGSVRLLKTDENLLAAIAYLRDQWRPLRVWVNPEPPVSPGG